MMRPLPLLTLVVLTLSAGSAGAGTITVRNLSDTTLVPVFFDRCSGQAQTQTFSSLSPGFEQTQTRQYSIVGGCCSALGSTGTNGYPGCSASTSSLADPAEPDQVLVTYSGTGPSNLTCAITFSSSPPPTNPPAAPYLWQVTQGQSNGGPVVSITWFDNSSDESSFHLERKTGSGSFQEIAVLEADSTSYSDSSVSTGVTYTYRVRACNAAGCSAYSNTGSITL